MYGGCVLSPHSLLLNYINKCVFKEKKEKSQLSSKAFNMKVDLENLHVLTCTPFLVITIYNTPFRKVSSPSFTLTTGNFSDEKQKLM